MTITLTPPTEAKLREMAGRERGDEHALADALLAQALKAAAHDHAELIAGLAAGRQVYAESRSCLFLDYAADVRERRQQRDAADGVEGERVAA